MEFIKQKKIVVGSAGRWGKFQLGLSLLAPAIEN